MTLTQRLDVYEKLMRLDKPIGILLLLWPTLWAVWIAARGWPPLGFVLIFVVGTVLMRSAGCAINDFADRDFDLCACYDSMVHMHPAIVEGYVVQMAERLTPGGVLWLDHSGRGHRDEGHRTRAQHARFTAHDRDERDQRGGS